MQVCINHIHNRHTGSRTATLVDTEREMVITRLISTVGPALDVERYAKQPDIAAAEDKLKELANDQCRLKPWRP